MKTCPYCASNIPDKNNHCPSCQAHYWEPHQSLQEKSKPAPIEEEKGCLSIIIIPVLLSAAVATALIVCGIIINLFVHFESNQVKILWIGASCLMGLVFYRIYIHHKKKSR